MKWHAQKARADGSTGGLEIAHLSATRAITRTSQDQRTEREWMPWVSTVAMGQPRVPDHGRRITILCGEASRLGCPRRVERGLSALTAGAAVLWTHDSLALDLVLPWLGRNRTRHTQRMCPFMSAIMKFPMLEGLAIT